jgi:type VI secretion system protein ImpE
MSATAQAERLFQDGHLSDAIVALGNALKADPGDIRNRTFLFELLCFAGAYDRASKQLAALASADAEAVLSSAWYQEALIAQIQRQEMFESGQLPAAEPEDAATVSGTLNGKPFHDLRDADPRIGARLEVIVGGRYTWFPFRHLERVEINPPARLRDLFWAPAELDGYGGDVLLPVMTPFAWRHPDETVRLGRMTDWSELESGIEVPEGQKIWLVDGEELPILEVRSLSISMASDGPK